MYIDFLLVMEHPFDDTEISKFADKLKYIAEESGIDLPNNSVKQNNIEKKLMDKDNIKSIGDFLQYTEERK